MQRELSMLSDTEQSWLAKIQFAEENVLQLIDALKQDDVVSQRWLAIAKTDIEKAFMALSRSITEQVKQ